MTISHKVELIPNNKHKTYFRMAFGCARKAYNWALERRQDYYRQGIRVSCLDLKKEFNAVKREQFPYVCEVSKHAVQQPFLDLNNAFTRFFKKLGGYPKFKKKRDGEGSFYIGGESVKLITAGGRQYIKIPKLEKVKMTEPLRFSGKINHVRIRQDGDKYFASFSIDITEDEFYRTHKANAGAGGPVGIDVGLKALAMLSSGVAVLPVKGKLDRLDKRARRLQRRLSRRKHPIAKGDKTPKSNNFKKLSRKLRKVHSRKKNVRSDYLHKATSVIVRHHGAICLESLAIKNMQKNRRISRSFSESGLHEFKRQVQYKSQFRGRRVVEAGRTYPSSKLCSCCGHKKADLSLSDRTYRCDACGHESDRDYNASLNLLHYLEEQVGAVRPELTPVDLTALLSDFELNQIATSEAEAGTQLKSYA